LATMRRFLTTFAIITILLTPVSPRLHQWVAIKSLYLTI